MKAVQPGRLKRIYRGLCLAVKRPPRDQIRQQLLEVLAHLRSNNRPSYVGSIYGLTPSLEGALRIGKYRIEQKRPPYSGYYLSFSSGGFSGSATEFPEAFPQEFRVRGGVEGERIAYEAQQAWFKQNGITDLTNPAKARKFFKNKFTKPFGIKLSQDSSTAGKIYLTCYILSLVPKRVLKSDAIKEINLSNYNDAAKRAAYDEGVVGVANLGINDRYLFTVFLLHELGHAVYHHLEKTGRKDYVDGLRERSIQAGAIYGTDYIGGNIKDRVEYISANAKEFIAENFMHFIVFGRYMIIPQHPSLTGELYNLYTGLYANRPNFNSLEWLDNPSNF